MARSLSRIMDQISRLQKEAAAIQNDVVDRIRKEITKYGLTAEQLFGGAPPRRAAKSKASAKATRPVKFADAIGNTWHGVGKRPDWLRQALEAGNALEEFLVGQPKAPAKKAARKKAVKKVTPAKSPAAKKSKTTPTKRAAPKKTVAAKKPAARKPRSKPDQTKTTDAS